MHILLFGAHRWGRESSLKLFRKWGYKLLLFADENEVVPNGIVATERVCRFKNGDVVSLKKLAEKLSLIIKSNAVMLAMDEYQLEDAAILADFLSIPFLPPQSANTTFNKHLTRNMWNDYVNTNPHLPLKSVEFSCFNLKIEKILESDGFINLSDNLIVKPNAYSGSIGVFDCNKKDLESTVLKVSNILDNETKQHEMQGIAFPKSIIAEEKIKRNKNIGLHAEFSAHVISISGKHSIICFSEKFLSVNCFEVGHLFPAVNMPDRYADIAQIVITDWLNKFEVKSCISNWEFIITPDDQLALVEVQLRPSGDNLMELIESSIGVNPFKCLLEGRLNFTLPKQCGVFWLQPEMPLDTIDKIIYPKDNNITIAELDLKSSKNWAGPTDWYNRNVHIMVCADSYNSLIEKAIQLAKTIKLSGKINGVSTNTRLRLSINNR